MSTRYRIEYSIHRRKVDDDDFHEIGFGSSGAWSDLDSCTHMIDAAVSHGEWETEPDQPDPDQIMNDIGDD